MGSPFEQIVMEAAMAHAEQLINAQVEHRFRALQSKLGRQIAERDQEIRELREQLAAYEQGGSR